MIRSTAARIGVLLIATAFQTGALQAQGAPASWLDAANPRSWNTPGLSIPSAPQTQGPIDARCRSSARPAELTEDKQLQDRGWDLVGAYQGGWRTVVIRATAGYDGMCRPRVYQAFVFEHGVFIGTLAPAPMDSRTDGALGQIFVQGPNRLTGEYARYATSDPLCCPSKTTSVEFEITNDATVVRPVAASTSSNQAAAAP